MKGINPSYPAPGEDKALDFMRAMGVPDPGTPEVEGWIYEHILSLADEDGGEDEPHHISCGCEDCMQDHPERFDEDWNNIYYVEPEELAQEAAQEKFERDWDI